MRGVIHVACALALALACSRTRARAQPLHRKPTPRARPVSTRPTHTGWWRLPPPWSSPLPVVLAPVPDLDRDDDTGVAARARLREAHVPGDFDVADRRGPPARGSPDERAKSDAAAYFSANATNARIRTVTRTNTARTPFTVSPRSVTGVPCRTRQSFEGVHAPRCLRDRPPTCTCLGSVHVRAPPGVLLRAGSFEGRSERSSAADRRAFASAADRRAVASAVTARRGAVRRPAGWLHVRRLAGRRRPPAAVCVFVDGVLSCCCDAGVRHRLRRLLRGQEELLRREKGRTAVRGEARADFRGENRGVGETRVDSFARSNSIRRKKTKNKKTTSDAGFSFF